MGKLLLIFFLSTSLAAAQLAQPMQTPSRETDATGSYPAAPSAEESGARPAGLAALPPAESAPAAMLITRPAAENLSQRCWAQQASKSECKVHWGSAIGQTWLHMGVLAAASLAKDEGLRQTTFAAIRRGDWFQRWFDSASNYWFTHWDQDSPWKDTYIGHPFLGAIQQGIWVQNDPYGMTLQWDNSPEYWKSRLRSLPLSVFASFEWKLGPISEASFGNSGYGPNRGIYRNPFTGKLSNDTGLGPLVTTPVGGFLWFWGEDVVDRHLMPKLLAKSHNPLYLLAISIATPARSAANLLRFKAPWYRPYRHVKAQWHRPPPSMAAVHP